LKFVSPSWDGIYTQSIELATRLRKSEHWPFDVIVGVSRGGLALTRILSDLLDIDNVVITRCEYYSDLAKTKRTPVITQKIQDNLRGKNVLLVDDVSDTGKSLIAIKRYLNSKRPRSLTIATAYLKPWTKVVPDYYVKETDAWIIFPWELYEAVKSLSKRVGNSAVAKTHIPSRYLQMLHRMDPSLPK
jgi:uncharacterized protein